MYVHSAVRSCKRRGRTQEKGCCVHTLARSWTRQHHAKAARSAPLLVFEISLICMKGSVVRHYLIEWNDLIGFAFDRTNGECLAPRLLEIICETMNTATLQKFTGFKNMLSRDAVGFWYLGLCKFELEFPPSPLKNVWGGVPSPSPSPLKKRATFQHRIDVLTEKYEPWI